MEDEIFVPEPNTWYDMKIHPAPKDDSRFMVGMWYGATEWSDSLQQCVRMETPVWRQALSHDENATARERYETRGWNHRNGPLRGCATHWMLAPAPPGPPPLVGSWL